MKEKSTSLKGVYLCYKYLCIQKTVQVELIAAYSYLLLITGTDILNESIYARESIGFLQCRLSCLEFVENFVQSDDLIYFPFNTIY